MTKKKRPGYIEKQGIHNNNFVFNFPLFNLSKIKKGKLEEKAVRKFKIHNIFKNFPACEVEMK